MHIHFVGIGGIGISALAKHFLLSGEKVTGSDLNDSEIVQNLIDMGADVSIGHSKDNITESVDKLVYSPAIPKDNPEMKKAKKLGIEKKSYPQALGELTKGFFTIAVSGTHGKSTTTCMISLILIEAGLDPTVIVGTKMKEFGDSNYRKGESDYLLIEADEWQGSLLNYNPDVVVLTNLESEHLDYYKDLDQIIDTFQKYIKNIKNQGVVIYNEENKNLLKLKLPEEKISFSKRDKEAVEIKNNLQVPGSHNLENGLAAFKVGKLLEIDEDKILKALSKYKGSWRRFEKKEIEINKKKREIIVDYAHHPTELKATLQALKEKYPQKSVTAIFQPHQYQRSYFLKDKFIDVFKNSPVEKLFVLDIYSVPGREDKEIKKKISSKILVEEADSKKVIHLSGDMKKVKKRLISSLQGDEIIAIIGAGDIYKLENILKDN